MRTYITNFELPWPWLWRQVWGKILPSRIAHRFLPTHPKVHHHCSFHARGNELYILLIWPNSLSSVSRDRATGTKLKIPASLRPGEGPRVLFLSVNHVGACRSGGHTSQLSGPVPVTLTMIVRKNYRRASLIDLYPHTKFHQDRAKKCGRTDIQSVYEVISLRWLNQWTWKNEQKKRSETGVTKSLNHSASCGFLWQFVFLVTNIESHVQWMSPH